MGLYADKKIGGLVFDGFKDFGPACMDDSRQRLLLRACKSLHEIFNHCGRSLTIITEKICCLLVYSCYILLAESDDGGQQTRPKMSCDPRRSCHMSPESIARRFVFLAVPRGFICHMNINNTRSPGFS